MNIPKSTRRKSDLILATFKSKFNDLNEKYQPHYSVVFYKIGEQGQYSNQVRNLFGEYNQLEHSDFIVMVKEYNDIKLYLNWKRLGVKNFNYHIETHFKFFMNLYSQAAFHEYAHTYFITSTSTMLYPSEVIDYLNTIGIKSVWSTPIPPKYQEEFKKDDIGDGNKYKQLLKKLELLIDGINNPQKEKIFYPSPKELRKAELKIN